MTLDAGTVLGRYVIQSRLGAGGMGEVYLAQDTQLQRTVALKILPDNFATDQQRMRRFVQEAKAAAALRHPNVAHIYELGELDGIRFISMEFIEGETLRQLTLRGPIKIPDALDIAAQIAGALVVAHESGIIHRDIKPENVIVRADGYVKVLDFGLAKLTDRAGDIMDTEAPTRAQINTAAGIIMGTANYMSPEQARGQDVDPRTDVWSLGVVLFEMITGQLPFQGSTSSDVIAKILERESPPLGRFRPLVPETLEWIVAKALTRSCEERYQTAKEMLADLKKLRRRLELDAEKEWSAQEFGSSSPAAPAIPSRALKQPTIDPGARSTANVPPHVTSSAEYIVNEIRQHKFGAAIILAVVLIGVAGLGFGLYRLVDRGRSIAPLHNRKITRLTNNGHVESASISPDGKYVAYSALDESGQSSLWIRHVATTSNVQIVPGAGPEVLFKLPVFSRDGNYVFYLKIEKNESPVLYQVPVLGGTSKKILEAVPAPISFSPDGKSFTFFRRDTSAREDALMVANADGTGVQKLAARKHPDYFLGGFGAAWSPDGKTIACPIGGFSGGHYRTVGLVQVADGSQRALTDHRWSDVQRIAWLADGSGVLIAAAEHRGDFHQIWSVSFPDGQVRQLTNDLLDYTNTSLTADSNVLAVVLDDVTSNIWVCPNGEWNKARQLTSGKYFGESEGTVIWTRNGKILYSTRVSENPDIWIMDADGRNQKQLTNDASYELYFSVTPDDRSVVFSSTDSSGTPQIFKMDLEGGNQKQLTSDRGFISSLSPDGKWVVYTIFSSSGFNLAKIPIAGGAPTQVTNKVAHHPSVSPDGKLIACIYSDTMAHTEKLGLLRFDGGELVKLIDLPQTGHANTLLVWSPDGRAVGYIDSRGGVSNIWLQPIDGSPPKQLTDFKSDRIFTFAWSRDGKWLAYSRGTEEHDVVLITDFR
jgi:eukaryotic-like serine/threonine-protein kinase